MKKSILTALMLIATVAMSAATYYCKPGGTGDGTSKAQAGEFTNLVKNLKAGDILYCLGGQYDYSNQISISASGTKDNYVKIWAAEGETPIFDFRKQAYGSKGFGTSGDYMHLKGLTIRYAGKNGIVHSGSYSIFENLDVYGNGDSGVQMKGGHSNLILNCDSHDNFDYQLGGVSSCDFGGNADGFADKQYTGGGNTYRGCRAWANSDDGWDFYQHKTGSYGPTVIENCVCYGNGPGKYNMVGHARYETDKSWFDQFKGEGKEVTDKRGGKRVVTLENYGNWGNANGFKLGGDKTVHNVKLINSIAVYNGNTFLLSADLGAKGIDQNNNAGEMWVYNNTSYNNARNIGFDQVACGTVHLYNNISYKGVSPDGISCPVHEEKNNSWNIEGLTLKDADFQSMDESQLLAPRQADGSLPETTFMHLASGSQLIDLGTTETGMEYYGMAPDLGCYETTEGGKHIPPTLSVSGNKTQTVKEGRSIQTVTITAGGSATAISRIDNTLVPGVNVNINGLVATVSGTPTQQGSYTLTFVPVTEEPNELQVNITIQVNEASACTVAYVSNGTDGSNDADKKIIEAISSAFDIQFFDASSTTNDYSDCDAIIISPVPSSGAAGVKALNTIALPTLLLKPFMMKSGVWGWGTAANTSDLAVTVKDATHPIFTGVNIQNNTINLFTKKDGDGAVTTISQPTNWSGYTLLASPTSNNNGITIADLTGATLNDTKIDNRFFLLGISEYSTAYLTEDAQKMVLNAVYCVLGKDIPTAIANVSEREKGKGVMLYDIMGRRVSAANARGTYIVKVVK